jgi:hypothetical protein
MSDTDVVAGSRGRGAPLLATWGRWALCAAVIAVAFAAALQGSLSFMHSTETIASFRGSLALAVALAALLLFWLLRAEESRLARELRTARTGTAALRGMVLGRRQQLPFFARLFSTRLGTAAVLLADGERGAALDLLAAGSPLMQGGRMSELRGVVGADADRAGGNPDALGRCIRDLSARRPIGNREADLYALHVLVKAVLEHGDVDAALQLVERLERSQDEDERLYVVWLRAWFDLDAGGATDASDGRGRGRGRESEGDIRLAALLARAHGAEKLVEKLEQRATAIARPQREE